MKFEPSRPPRRYSVGITNKVTIKDVGRLKLSSDEQVTIENGQGAQLDVTRKDWGFYATPSLNGRLRSFGLRPVLVRNNLGKYFVLLLEEKKEKEFSQYIEEHALAVILWLDDGAALDRKFLDIEEA